MVSRAGKAATMKGGARYRVALGCRGLEVRALMTTVPETESVSCQKWELGWYRLTSIGFGVAG